jgi:hypothetical protein
MIANRDGASAPADLDDIETKAVHTYWDTREHSQWMRRIVRITQWLPFSFPEDAQGHPASDSKFTIVMSRRGIFSLVGVSSLHGIPSWPISPRIHLHLAPSGLSLQTIHL